jgi:hypothetical protein
MRPRDAPRVRHIFAWETRVDSRPADAIDRASVPHVVCKEPSAPHRLGVIAGEASELRAGIERDNALLCARRIDDVLERLTVVAGVARRSFARRGAIAGSIRSVLVHVEGRFEQWPRTAQHGPDELDLPWSASIHRENRFGRASVKGRKEERSRRPVRRKHDQMRVRSVH